jgi:hypothetical protein
LLIDIPIFLLANDKKCTQIACVDHSALLGKIAPRYIAGNQPNRKVGNLEDDWAISKV